MLCKLSWRICFHSAFITLISAFILGCDSIGPPLGLIARQFPRHIDAAYKGMAGQTTIVMVWVDPGIRDDNPDLQMDIAATVQDKLIDIIQNEKPDLLKGTNFPVRASTVIHNQENHPEWNNESITDTAAKFDGTRLIYMEIKEFSTHSGSPDLYRGILKGDLKVIEMKDGTAKIAYTENDIAELYPKDSPNDGLPVGTDATITQGAVDAFATDIAKRFYPHDEERN